MNHCYHLHTVQPSSVPLNQEQRPPNTTQLEPIRLQTNYQDAQMKHNSKFAQYSTNSHIYRDLYSKPELYNGGLVDPTPDVEDRENEGSD